MRTFKEWSGIFGLFITILLFLIAIIRTNTSDSIKAANESCKTINEKLQTYPNRNELDAKLTIIKSDIIELKETKANKEELTLYILQSKERDERIENKLDKLIYMHLHAINIDTTIKLQYLSPINAIVYHSLKDTTYLFCKK